MDKDLLEILACPLTKQPLREASAAEVAAWNERVRAGKLKTSGGKPAEPFEAALVRQDGKVVYAIRDRIPVLLPDEGIAV
ncbi:MAG: hypothetical protein FJ299_14425 [Planctomycetes bacterium]|nr:hypothetical protein [Planctomycetota bacterium]